MSSALLETGVHLTPGVGDMPDALLTGLLDSAYRGRRKKPARLDLLITTDEEIARLNRRHLGKDCPTDVLAFDDGEEEEGRIRLGDVAISADTAHRVSAERGVTFEQELAFYALHGLFHLLGMRDDSEAERADMHKAQAEALRAYGIEPEAGL